MGATASTTRGRIRPGIALVLVAAVAVAGLALGLLLTQGTNQTAPAAELASVQTGCKQWLGANPSESGTVQWCASMASWMSQYMNRSGVGPQMMWGDSDHMLSTCEQWMTTSPPSGTATAPQSWCNSMVSWMTSHMSTWSGQSTWGGWMSHGSMMGSSEP
jgi:hypothetical protein